MENLPLETQIEMAEHDVLSAQNHLAELIAKKNSQRESKVKFIQSLAPGAIYGQWADGSTSYYYPNTASNHPNCNPPPLSGMYPKS